MPNQSTKRGTPSAPTQQSTDPGPAKIRLAFICWGIAFAVLIAGIAWLGAPGVFDSGSPDFFPLPAGFSGIFALFGFFHLGRGLRDLARRRKTGLSSLDAGSARLGKAFTGHIRTTSDVAATGPYKIRLACEHHTATIDAEGDGSRRHTVILWERALTAPNSVRSDVGIPFSFDIPADGLSSDPRGLANGDYIVWKLSIGAPTSGLDYAADFVVDVRSETEGDEARPRSVESAFRGYARPEQAGIRFLRFGLPILGTLLVAAGGYASASQVFLSWRGAPVTGTILAFNRSQADVALDSGQKVVVLGLSSHNRWQEGQRVDLTCRIDGSRYETCRMDTGSDRWIDALATFAIGLVLVALGAWLWLRRRFAAAKAM